MHLPAREPARRMTIRLALRFDCMQLGPKLHASSNSSAYRTYITYILYTMRGSEMGFSSTGRSWREPGEAKMKREEDANAE